MSKNNYKEDTFLKRVLGEYYDPEEIKKAKNAAKNDMKGKNGTKKDRSSN